MKRSREEICGAERDRLIKGKKRCEGGEGDDRRREDGDKEKGQRIEKQKRESADFRWRRRESRRVEMYLFCQ